MFGLSQFEEVLSRARLVVNPGRCLRLRHRQSSCRLCLENCPTGAISFDGSLQIDSSRCPGCGVCASLCPTDVFELSDRPDEQVLAGVRAGDVVEFTCSCLPPGKGDCRVPCLGYLNEAILIGVVAAGAQAVRLNITQCRDCHLFQGLRVAVKKMRQANRILALFSLPGKISVKAGKPISGYRPGEGKRYSRREFFSGLGKGTREMVASAVEGVEMTAKTKVTLEPSLPKKRSLLLEHLKKLGEPVTDRAKADGLPFARVEISDRCNGCGRCVTFCPSGALKSYERGERQVIDFSSGDCLACDLCADICPEGALTYSVHINPYDLITGNSRILVEHSTLVCPQCGQTHIAVPESGLCLKCRKKKGLEEWLVGRRQHS